MPVKLSTTINKIENIPNITNRALLTEFHKYLNSNGVSESHQNNNLKALTAFAHFLGSSISFSDIRQNDLMISFLDSKLKGIEDDPDRKSIVTWNDYLEKQKLEFLLKTKKWNPYCIRHSAITSDSDFLPEYALKKKVRWCMNSKQGARYIKRRMGNDLKQKILAQNGIISEQQIERKPSILNCPRCSLVNAIENKYCSKCSYPLVPSAFDEIKEAENKKMQEIQQKYEQDMNAMKEQMSQIMSMIQHNPSLAQVKPEVLSTKRVG